MTTELEHIKSFFPFPEARDGQIETIQTILDSLQSQKFFILDAPTGAGKSVIGTTVARVMGESYYITAQKLLQDQLMKDFGEFGDFGGSFPLIDLKGRNAYECDYYKHFRRDHEAPKTKESIERFEDLARTYVDCAKGECKKKGKGKLNYCVNNNICKYLNQVVKAVRSPHTLMNFHSFIFQTQMTDRWNKRSLLIIDECHNTEQILLDYVSLDLTDINFNLEFPNLGSAEEYLIYFEDIGLLDHIKTKILEAVSTSNDQEEEFWLKQAFKYKNFKSALMSDEQWVHKFEPKTREKAYNRLEFKPLFIRNFAPMLFDMADNVLMMSATVLNHEIFTDSLGIKSSDYEYLALPNRFPKENRKIHYVSSGSMSFNNKAKTMPKMLVDVEKILTKHSEDKGIIHTHNFEITKYIIENIDDKHKDRLISQLSIQNKNELLELHKTKPNSVIVAPAFHEGLDLKNDLSRFQLICKVPYPSLNNNPQLERRMKLSSEYYLYITALKLCQSYGRSIRSETDHAETYVLDTDFRTFVNRSRSILPGWFIEAIEW